MFWFRKTQVKKPYTKASVFFLCFLFFLFFIILWLNTLANFNKTSFQDKANIVKRITWGVDRQLSNMVQYSSHLLGVLQSGGAILDYPDEIQAIFDTLEHNQTIQKNVPEQYKDLYDFGLNWVKYKEEIIDLLGPDRPRSYLIALMNTNEVRPNGGFFGSYAIVKIYKGKLMQYEIFDSYYAYHQDTWVKLMLEKNYQYLLWQESINFISPNVYGWTSQDAGNIKLLYERLFRGQLLDGVILVKSDLLEDILPSIKSKLSEWQFVNACIDLIRWKVEANKKEKYLADIGSYLEDNKSEIISQIIKNIPTILKKDYIQVYLPKSSEEFQEFLAEQWLEKSYKPDAIQIQHVNKSFNKIDNMVSKKYILQDASARVITETMDTTISTKDLWLKGGQTYDLYLFYALNVPQTYLDQIYGLTKQFAIELTPRETHILWLSYNWHNQIILHLPEDMIFDGIDGEIFCKSLAATKSTWTLSSIPKDRCYKVLEWKYNQIVSFDMIWFSNNDLRVVRVRLKKI